MRVLAVHPGPHFSVADVHNGWVKGLRQNGCEVLDFSLDDRLEFYGNAERGGKKILDPDQSALLASKGIEVACYEWQPDVVLITSGFFVPPVVYEAMKRRGETVVLLHTESPYEDDRQTARARFADLNILNDPTNIDRFPPGTLYVPHAYDPDIHHPGPVEPELVSDFCFVGTGYPSRIAFLEAVDWTGIDAVLGGHWGALEPMSPLFEFLAHEPKECLDNDQAIRLYRSTKASVNLYRKEGTDVLAGWAMGPREVELAASGTFFLREPRGESDEVLGMVPTFESPDDFSKKLRWWLDHDDDRDEAAVLAREAVSDRTFDANAARLLDALSA